MTDSRPRPRRSALERALRPFTEVRSGEGAPALRMLASLFALVAANAVVKPARDGFLAAESIAGISEMELKAYTSFAQALLLFGLVPAYAAFSARVPRSTLVTRVTLGFAAMLVLFWALRPGLVVDDVPFFGIAFYLWVGVFNVFAVSQFWVLGADLHSPEGGRRLFPLIGIGASAGAAGGSWAARALLRSGLAET
jgi:ATP:ADP antiporter, AAA family